MGFLHAPNHFAGRLARPTAASSRAARVVVRARRNDGVKPRAAGAFVEAEAATQKASLYDQIGGAPSVEAAVGLFYEKVYADDRVAKWFEGVSKEGQLAKMIGFLTCVLKGHIFDGDLTEPHKRLVVDGMSDKDFDVIAELFIATLDELGVGEPIKGEIVGLVASTREAVMGRV